MSLYSSIKHTQEAKSLSQKRISDAVEYILPTEDRAVSLWSSVSCEVRLRSCLKPELLLFIESGPCASPTRGLYSVSENSIDMPSTLSKIPFRIFRVNFALPQAKGRLDKKIQQPKAIPVTIIRPCSRFLCSPIFATTKSSKGFRRFDGSKHIQ